MKKMVIAAASVIAFSACSAENSLETPAQPVEIVAAEAILEDGVRVVRWSTAPEGAAVTVEMTTDPDAAPGTGETVSVDDADGEYRAEDVRLDERVYFIVSAPSGDFDRAALRVLPLEGGRNFRDLGGYETIDGHSVKWGEVFRSGVMTGLTDQDYDYLSDLGVKVVCDFRSIDERDREPTDWKAGAIDYVTWDYRSEDEAALGRALSAPDASPESVAAAMTSFYRELPYRFAERYAVMFDRLAKGETPLAFNCSAGKDRTGVAAALILTALGAPRETVLADYALSEKVVDYMADYRDAPAEESEDGPYAFFRKLPPELVAPLMRSDPKYLEAAFESIEADQGSVLAFIQSDLGVDDEELAAIRDRLLEKTED